MLTQILTHLISETMQGRPAKKKLNGGLHIRVTAHQTSYTLILSRDGSYPSEKEWQTVLNHWPYHIEKIGPSKITDSDRRPALKAEIPTARAIQNPLL